MYLLTRYSAIAEAGVVIAREFSDKSPMNYLKTRAPRLVLTIPGDRYTECSLIFKTNVGMLVISSAMLTAPFSTLFNVQLFLYLDWEPARVRFHISSNMILD